MLGDTTGAIPKSTPLRRSARIKDLKNDTGETSDFQTQSKIQISPISNTDNLDNFPGATKTPKPKYSSTPKNVNYDLRHKPLAENQDNLDEIEISPVVEKINKGKNKTSNIPETPKTTQSNLRSSQRVKQKKLSDNANPDYKWFHHVYQKWDNMYDWTPNGQYYYYQ